MKIISTTVVAAFAILSQTTHVSAMCTSWSPPGCSEMQAMRQQLDQQRAEAEAEMFRQRHEMERQRYEVKRQIDEMEHSAREARFSGMSPQERMEAEAAEAYMQLSPAQKLLVDEAKRHAAAHAAKQRLSADSEDAGKVAIITSTPYWGTKIEVPKWMMEIDADDVRRSVRGHRHSWFTCIALMEANIAPPHLRADKHRSDCGKVYAARANALGTGRSEENARWARAYRDAQIKLIRK